MADLRCRVTVVGARKSVDVAVQASARVGEYVPTLARICGETTNESLPRAWSLAVPGGAPLPPGASLAEAGILDGQVLYLTDLTESELDDPVVRDVTEVVAEETARLRRAGPQPGVITMVLGLMWIVAAAAHVVTQPQESLVACVAPASLGLILLVAAWTLGSPPTAVPPPIRLLIALAGVPCMAVAGGMAAASLFGHGFWVLGALGAANVSAVIALATVPESVIVAVGLQLFAASLVAVLVTIVHGTAPQAAAATALVSLGLLATAPQLAARIAGTLSGGSATPNPGHSSGHRVAGPPSGINAVTDMLVRSRRLLTVISAGPVLALMVALPVLALSGEVLAWSLAIVASIAVLMRARQSGFATEALPLSAAALVGLFFALVFLLRWLDVAALTGPALAAMGASVLALGVAAVTRRPTPRRAAPSIVNMAEPPRRGKLDVVGMVCNGACGPLAMGVFGVFGALVEAGRDMLG